MWAVPPIDLDRFRGGTSGERREVGRALDTACRADGFFTVSGHGIPASTCAAVLDTFGAFFDLSVADKRRWIVADDSANRGYSELGKEGLAYSRGDETPPDLFEAFNVGREDAVGDYYDRHRAFYAPNVWPDEPAGLHEAWLEYERAASRVANTILELMAVALGLEERWFVDRCRRAIVTTRANHYRRSPDAPEPALGQMRMGAHTDYGIVTILLADPVPGLQVLHDATWRDVVIPDGALVCNIGDMLQLWTNDAWVSTMHRVVPPPRGVDGPVRRRSIARFLDCEPDLVVSCIPSCCSTAEPARHDPVVAGEWLMAKILGGRRRALPA